jgi:HPt (histidine-containing phosphotransfer) domain-containing protein
MSPAFPGPAGDDRTPAGPAIDIAGGIDRLMGDRAMYARVLNRFRNDYQGAAVEIRAALENGEHALAQRLAHTLKGAAGMIEAHTLQRRALALELALRAGHDDYTIALGLMAAELQRVLGEIGQVAPGDGAIAPANLWADRSPGLVERLRALLDVGDGAATDLIRENRERLVALLGAARFGEVAAAADVFDYVLALRLLGPPGH